MNKRLLLGIIACLVIPFLGAVVATDFTITRQLGDATNAFLIENFAGVDLFWIDKDGYAFSNGTLVVTNGANVGAGSQVFSAKSSDDLQFRTLQAGNGTTVTTKGNVIEINATSGGGGEANLGANVGTGIGVFRDKTGVTLNFHSLAAGSGVSITDIGNELRINSTASAITTMESLTNVTNTGCATGQILKVSGNTWGCADGAGTATASYIIYTDGNNFFTINGTTGDIDSQGTNA